MWNLWGKYVALPVAGVLLGACLAQAFFLNQAYKDLDALRLEIYAPVTGYVPRLAQCHANTATLEDSLIRSSEAVERLTMEGEARKQTATEQVAAAQKAARDSDKRLHDLLNRPPEGSTMCERIEDIDSRFMETLR